MRSCQLLPGFLAVLALLLLAGEVTLQAFQLLLSLTVVSRIVDCVALRVGIERFESDINPHLLACRLMHDGTRCLYPKLHTVAIRTMHDAYPFDLRERKGCNLLLGIANHPQASNPTPIGQGDVLAIGLKLPTRLLVLHRPVIPLKC